MKDSMRVYCTVNAAWSRTKSHREVAPVLIDSFRNMKMKVGRPEMGDRKLLIQEAGLVGGSRDASSEAAASTYSQGI